MALANSCSDISGEFTNGTSSSTGYFTYEKFPALSTTKSGTRALDGASSVVTCPSLARSMPRREKNMTCELPVRGTSRILAACNTVAENVDITTTSMHAVAVL